MAVVEFWHSFNGKDRRLTAKEAAELILQGVEESKGWMTMVLNYCLSNGRGTLRVEVKPSKSGESVKISRIQGDKKEVDFEEMMRVLSEGIGLVGYQELPFALLVTTLDHDFWGRQDYFEIEVVSE